MTFRSLGKQSLADGSNVQACTLLSPFPGTTQAPRVKSTNMKKPGIGNVSAKKMVAYSICNKA